MRSKGKRQEASDAAVAMMLCSVGENSLYEKVHFWLEKFHKFISFSKNS